MPTFTADQLKRVGISLLEAAGATREEADGLATSLVETNLVGHDSHGIRALPTYVKRIREGAVKPGANIEVVHETLSTALIDANWGLGYVVAKKAMNIAIEKARTCSISAIGIFHCNHIGRIGQYSMMAAEQGMIGIVACNSTHGEEFKGIMVPYGGKAPKFDTNPISVAVPAGEMPPFLLDFATSTVAEGKISIALERGDSIPRDWILDENGNPTTDPGALKRGGVMLPFGGHKGYAIAMLVDILSGVLTGAGSPSLAEKEEKRSSQGVFMAVINISSFTPIKTFYKRIDEMLKNVKQTPPAPGFKEVFIPGEPEFDAKKKRTEEGISISEKTWQAIMEAGRELGLDVTRILKSG